MAAYRMDGGRLFYVEHECASAESKAPSSRHLVNGRVHNDKYVVRMFYLGDLNASMANVSKFAYLTDGVGAGGPNAYVNCPLCGSEGCVVVDKNNLVEIREAYNQAAVTESPFR